MDNPERQQGNAKSVKSNDVKEISPILLSLIPRILEGQAPSADIDYETEFDVIVAILR